MATAEIELPAPPAVILRQADDNVMKTEFLPFPTKRFGGESHKARLSGRVIVESFHNKFRDPLSPGNKWFKMYTITPTSANSKRIFEPTIIGIGQSEQMRVNPILKQNGIDMNRGLDVGKVGQTTYTERKVKGLHFTSPLVNSAFFIKEVRPVDRSFESQHGVTPFQHTPEKITREVINENSKKKRFWI